MEIKQLESWYQKHKRDLVFRHTSDPYAVWVSEIMLQQTQVDTVIPYYIKFMKKYPSIKDLAQANEEDLQKDLEGIGYYRRFRLMQKAARVMMDTFDGDFPKTYEQVLSLPGIGIYTAGAIMSIAYDKPYSAVDGNVIRVLSRYLGLYDDFRLDKHKIKLNQINQKFVEQSRPNIYTQSLIELGALICKPKQPKCETCPLYKTCHAYQHHTIDQLPYLSKLKAKTEVNQITLILEKDDKIYLKKQEESLLKGMYLYPQYESESIESVISLLEEQGIFIRVNARLKSYKHVFTHKVWHMDVFVCQVIRGMDLKWTLVSKKEVLERPMAIAHRKINVIF